MDLLQTAIDYFLNQRIETLHDDVGVVGVVALRRG